MKNAFMKTFAVVLALFLTFNVVQVSASSDAILSFEDYSVALTGSSNLESYVNMDQFEEYLREQMWACNETIDISSYKIPFTYDFLNEIASYIRGEMPELFHVNGAMSGRGNTYFSSLLITYDYSGQELTQRKSDFYEKINKMISGVKGNSSLTDVEKALLLHDRLALVCEYDYTYSKRTSYEAIVEGESVCEGYAKAYSVLLDQVGIESDYCASGALNHAWNIVYIGGNPYHVDVTWDDPSWEKNERGVLGLVLHENFLRSTQGIKATGHEADDFISSPVDTTYDNWFWQSSETAFTLLDGEIYYIDGEDSELKRYSDGKSLCSVYDRWFVSNTEFYVGRFNRLTTDGTYLYYSMSDSVYRYDVKTNQNEKLFDAELSGYNSIYGLDYIDGYLVYDTNNAAPFGDGNSLSQKSYLVLQENEIVIKDTSSLYEKDGYLKGLGKGSKVADILGQLENTSVMAFDKNGNVLSDDDICSTGCTIKLMQGDDLLDSVSVVVMGDVDGSGSITSSDYLKVKSAFLSEYKLEGAYKSAADMDENQKINTADFLALKTSLIKK